MEFVHLNVKTSISFCESTLGLSLLPSRLVGVADSNWSGVFDLHDAYQKPEQKVLIGFDASVQGLANPHIPPQKLRLYPMDTNGFTQLMALTSLQELSSGVLSWEQIKEHAGDFLAVTGSMSSEIGYALYKGWDPSAALFGLQEIFGDRLYLEVQDHQLVEPWEGLCTTYCLGQSHVKLLLTNEVRYATSMDAASSAAYFFHTLDKFPMSMERSRFTYSSEFYLKSEEEMLHVANRISSSYPNGSRAFQAYGETGQFAARCHKISHSAEPQIPIIADADENLTKKVWQGFKELYPSTYLATPSRTKKQYTLEDARKRIDYELSIIKQKQYSSYFLILLDLVTFLHQRGIAFGIRGSAGASAVLYALGITEHDPLKYDLWFERFLNPERVSEPDVDVDVAATRRHEVLTYLIKKYGKDRVALIRTRSELGGNSAWRAACKAHLVTIAEEDRVAKLLTNLSLTELREKSLLAVELKPVLRDAIFMEDQQLVAGFGTHAAGVIVSKDILAKHVPMTCGDENVATAVAFDMQRAEKQKLMKIDVLAVKMLDVLSGCKQVLGLTTLKEIPLNDDLTYDYFSEGHTFGIFQFNKVGDIVRSMGISSIEDIMALNALNRPGPKDEIPSFINRLHGKETFDTFHPDLYEALSPTFGVIAYQETIMEVAQLLSGFSLGKADLLRRAISKKDKVLMDEMKAEFFRGANGIGHSDEFAAKIFAFIEKFAEYGFPKPHALDYAVRAYRCAYFKCHYPVLYMSELLKAHEGEPDNSDNSPMAIRMECKRMGILFLPPAINECGISYKAEPHLSAIRYGLASLKGIGESQAGSILAAAPYSSILDFIRRSGATKRSVEILGKAGAFDSFMDRRILPGILPLLMDWSLGETYTLLPAIYSFTDILPGIRESSIAEVLQGEMESLGAYITDHPLRAYRRILKQKDCMDIRSLDQVGGRVGGIITRITEFKSKKGAFITLEDETGNIEAMIFNNSIHSIGSVEDLQWKPFIVELSFDQRKRKWTVKALIPLLAQNEIVLCLQNADELAQLSKALLPFQDKPGQSHIVALLSWRREAIDLGYVHLTGKLEAQLIGYL